MLAFFRTNQTYANFLLFVYALLLQLPPMLAGGWDVVASLLPVLIISATAWLANAYILRNNASRHLMLFPGLFVILCWAMVPFWRRYDPVQPALFFIMAALYTISNIYKKNDPSVSLFNTGMSLGIAALFEPAALLLFPAFVVGLGILRTPDLKSILQLLTGTILPLFFALTYAYYTSGTVTDFLAEQFGSFGILGLSPLKPYDHMGLIVLGLLLVLAIVYAGRIVRLLNIQGKKGINLAYWLMLMSLIPLFFGGAHPLILAAFVLLPLGILTGLWIAELSASIAEVIHLLLVAAATTLSVLASLS